jgi:protein TonB
MEKKKNPKANLERTKSIFLFIGLITAISVLIFAFSWSSPKTVSETKTGNETIIEENVKITKQDKEIKKDKLEKPIPKKVIMEVIKLVEDTTTIVETVPFWTEEDTFVYEDPIEDPGDEPILYCANPPEFPGGSKALQLWVANHVVYPALARENNIEGTVHLRFEVKKDGKIGRIEVLNKNIDKLLQEASVDVIKKLPKFKPGMQNGAYVNVWFSIPINFVLQK